MAADFAAVVSVAAGLPFMAAASAAATRYFVVVAIAPAMPFAAADSAPLISTAAADIVTAGITTADTVSRTGAIFIRASTVMGRPIITGTAIAG